MGLKIKIAIPFLPNYVKEVEFDDFERIDIGIKGEKNSNHFLWQLWHLFDVKYTPETADGFVPWAFMPSRYCGKKNNVVVLGNINTAIGNFHVAISYVKKGDIDSICFYSGIHNDSKTKRAIRDIVNEAKCKIEQVETFHCKVEIFSNFDKLKFSTYVGDRFKIYTMNEKIYVAFDILCADKYEAYHLGMERMKFFLAFLSVETNILFDYDSIDFGADQDNVDTQHMLFMQNYIDHYSIIKDEVVLSKEAFLFLNEYLFVERDLCLDRVAKYFLLGCVHVLDGLTEESYFEDIVKYTLKELSYSVMRRHDKNKQERYTHCIMHFLSAIETASFDDSSHEVCKTCGNVKYKIGARVKDFVAKYINEDLGKLFKGLYSIRSHYLHTGILSTSGDFLNARPLLDMGTDSGIIDSSFISVKINGYIKNVYANNIKEWTTYCLRCYYHEKLFNNINFEVEDIYNNNSSSYIKHISELKLVSKIEGSEITGVEPT